MPRKSSEFHVSSHLIPPNVPPVVSTHQPCWPHPVPQDWKRLATSIRTGLASETKHSDNPHTHAYILRTSSTLVDLSLHTWQTINSSFILPYFHMYTCTYTALICVPAACNHSCKVPEAASLLWTTGWTSGTQAGSAEGDLREGGEDGEGGATTTCQRVSMFELLWYYWTIVYYISICMAYQCIHESMLYNLGS